MTVVSDGDRRVGVFNIYDEGNPPVGMSADRIGRVSEEIEKIFTSPRVALR